MASDLPVLQMINTNKIVLPQNYHEHEIGNWFSLAHMIKSLKFNIAESDQTNRKKSIITYKAIDVIWSMLKVIINNTLNSALIPQITTVLNQCKILLMTYETMNITYLHPRQCYLKMSERALVQVNHLRISDVQEHLCSWVQKNFFPNFHH